MGVAGILDGAETDVETGEQATPDADIESVGAYTHLWSNGIYVYEYNEAITQRMKEIEEEFEQ